MLEYLSPEEQVCLVPMKVPVCFFKKRKLEEK